jgi:hypothetical protein
MLVTETSISLPGPLISQEESLACELFTDFISYC